MHRATPRGSIQVSETRYTCRVINIGYTPPASESRNPLLPTPRTVLASTSFSFCFFFFFSFFYALESRPEVYNLARKVRGHAATQQSAYAYTAIYRRPKPSARKRPNRGRPVDNAGCRRPFSFRVEKYPFSSTRELAPLETSR